MRNVVRDMGKCVRLSATILLSGKVDSKGDNGPFVFSKKAFKP